MTTTTPIFSGSFGPRNFKTPIDFSGYESHALEVDGVIKGYAVTFNRDLVGEALYSKVGRSMWNTFDRYENRQHGRKMMSAKTMDEAVSGIAVDHYIFVRNGLAEMKAIVNSIPVHPRFPGSMIKERVRSATFGRSALRDSSNA